MTNLELVESWVPAACTLPTSEQPLRIAEFDELFTTSIHRVERRSAERAVFMVAAEAEAVARDLAAREVECCSFFDFDFAPAAGDAVALTVGVPPNQVAVLDALTRRAETGIARRGGATP
jgi:hypothetical protein